MKSKQTAYESDCEGLDIQVLSSAAGYYLGTWSPELGPCTRDSGYYRTKEEAQEALDSGNWEQRMHP